MFSSLLNALLGCTHPRTTFPLTPAHRVPGVAAGATYVVCLECGKELEYDWAEMRVGRPVGSRLSARTAHSLPAANR